MPATSGRARVTSRPGSSCRASRPSRWIRARCGGWWAPARASTCRSAPCAWTSAGASDPSPAGSVRWAPSSRSVPPSERKRVMSDDDHKEKPPEERGPDEPPPLDAGRLVEEVKEELEHVAEEVRGEVAELHEKIEDMVEHALPRRARWSAGRIAWMILLAMAAAVVLLVGGVLVYFTQNSVWAAGELQRLINQALAQQSNVVLEVRDLEGNPLKKVRLIEPRVRFRDRRGPAILEASSMTVAYTPWNLWIGRRRSIEITLERPVVRLTQDKDGHWVLPEWRAGPRARGRPRELEVLLHLRDGTIVIPDTTGNVAGWSFDARALTGTVT